MPFNIFFSSFLISFIVISIAFDNSVTEIFCFSLLEINILPKPDKIKLNGIKMYLITLKGYTINRKKLTETTEA